MASLLFGNLAKMNLNPRSQAWCGLYPQMRGIPREAVSSHLPLPLGFCFQTCVFCSNFDDFCPFADLMLHLLFLF